MFAEVALHLDTRRGVGTPREEDLCAFLADEALLVSRHSAFY
jgi:hypothetical protein